MIEGICLRNEDRYNFPPSGTRFSILIRVSLRLTCHVIDVNESHLEMPSLKRKLLSKFVCMHVPMRCWFCFQSQNGLWFMVLRACDEEDSRSEFWVQTAKMRKADITKNAFFAYSFCFLFGVHALELVFGEIRFVVCRARSIWNRRNNSTELDTVLRSICVNKSQNFDVDVFYISWYRVCSYSVRSIEHGFRC